MQRMEAHLQQRLEQRMKLSQQMLQNLELLQMPLMDLREEIMQELQENPVLELKEDVEESEEPAAEPTPEAEERQLDMLEAAEEQWRDAERTPIRRGGDDEKQEFLQNASAPATTLREHLRNQLSPLEITGDLRRYVEHIIESIDDHGFLIFPLEELVQSLPEDLRTEAPEILLKRLESALAVVQKMDPRGVGARNTKECLLLQLDESEEIFPLLRFLIENHLEDISHNRFPRIAKVLLENPEMRALLAYEGEPNPDDVMTDVKFLVAEISRLHLRPAANFAGDRVPKVYPEVVIRQIDGKYEIQLEDSYLPPISLNRSYLEMLRNKTLSKDERVFLRGKMDAGKRLISAIEQRRSTIQKITAQILARQVEFFDHGMEHLKPLKMQEIADSLGIHVSTVSRALSDKYVETPRGIFPLKFFFPSSAAPKRDGALPAFRPPSAPSPENDPQTRNALKEIIREIVAAEDGRNPLSDLEIVKILKSRGIQSARRTVAKYREEMNIPSSRIRQKY